MTPMSNGTERLGASMNAASFGATPRSMKGFEDYFATWERLDLRPEELIDTGDELVVFVHEVARGRESDMVVETDTATISTLRDGMIVRVRNFMDRSEALEAAGLRE